MPASNYYDLLGVSSDATADEIRSAYRRRAMVFHPDRHTAAPPEVQLEAERIMAGLNVAYETLGDEDRRRRYDETLQGYDSRVDEWLSAARPPRPGECWMCASTPATEVTLHQHVGKLLWREKRVMQATLCRSCGRAMVASITNRTMVTGWWGAISFFANWAAIWNNWQQWRRLSTLSPPRPNGDRVIVPMPEPAPPSKPLLQWGGVWVTAMLLLFLASIAIGEQQGATASSPRPSTPAPGSSNSSGSGSSGGSSIEPANQTVTIYDYEGLCLRYDSTGQHVDEVVECYEYHDAEVVDVVSTIEHCYTEYYFVLEDGVLCVDG